MRVGAPCCPYGAPCCPCGAPCCPYVAPCCPTARLAARYLRILNYRDLSIPTKEICKISGSIAVNSHHMQSREALGHQNHVFALRALLSAPCCPQVPWRLRENNTFLKVPSGVPRLIMNPSVCLSGIDSRQAMGPTVHCAPFWAALEFGARRCLKMPIRA